jgi:HD-GYP domain-containing protein (c-di-GMP phosphodiesterase class II)
MSEHRIQELETIIKRLNSIGIHLSTQTNSDELFSFILEECMKLTKSDGGSIYIKKIVDEKAFIEFSYTKNCSKTFPFSKFMMPLDKTSLAGYSGYTGEICNFESMEMTERIGLTHNKKFDEENDYHTCNMLVVPMKNFSGQVIGVIQLINKKDDYDYILESPDDCAKHINPYTKEEEELISSLTSQCAILLERNTLLDDIRKLFKTFIESLVTSLDQRDPVTAGHSSRVAGYSVCLAKKVAQAGGVFADTTINEDDLKAIYYAGLLHDIGKIGVKESVLLKRNRLTDDTIEAIRHKCQVLKYNLLYEGQEFSEEEIADILDTFSFISHKEALLMSDNEKKMRKFIKENAGLITSKLYETIEAINTSGFLPEENEHFLKLAAYISYIDDTGQKVKLLSKMDLDNLYVKRGNLNDEERKMMNNHPLFTFDVLKEIAWTDQLKQVPTIAAYHHEKLCGKGYPWGLKENEIPLFSRILAIADIFDALTAKDRPYKPALSVEKTIDILREEVKYKNLDGDLVNLFIEEKAYDDLNHIDYSSLY